MPFSFSHSIKAEKFNLTKIWNKTKKHVNGKVEEEDKVFAEVIGRELGVWTRPGAVNSASCDKAVATLRNRVKVTLKNNRKKKRNQLLLLEGVKLLAEYRVSDRSLVRALLGDLLQLSCHIDRQVLFFEHAHLESPLHDLPPEQYTNLLERQQYIMGQVSGWKLPSSLTWIRVGDEMTYLEMPIQRVHVAATNHLLSEAIYRQRNPDLLLMLLRHGVVPSCIYLWPLCILIDAQVGERYSRILNVINPDYCMKKVLEEAMESEEVAIIHHFCRARNNIHMHYINQPSDRDAITNLPANVSFDDLLVIPARLAPLVPEDRHTTPPVLKHLTRTLIRRVMLSNDQLPGGLSKLPLPIKLTYYLDLLYD